MSTPIEWHELSRIAPAQHTMTSVRRRLAQRDDPWADLHTHAQVLVGAQERLDA